MLNLQFLSGRKRQIVCWLHLGISPLLLAQERISLIDSADAAKEWRFNNGAEFPGATGSLAIDPEASRQELGSLRLIGDFTQGGGYVQAGRKFEPAEIRELSFWVRCPGIERFTLRLSDATGQTHQIVLKAEPSPDWQQMVLPLERFFESRGQADAITSVAKYTSWGGAKDGNWHGPAKAIYLLLSNGGDNKVQTLWINDLTVVPQPSAVPGAEVTTTIPLSEVVNGVHQWEFNAEGKGSLAPTHDVPNALTLQADFTMGGQSVAAILSLDGLEGTKLLGLRLKLRSANAQSLTLRLKDGSGQMHQRRGFKIEGDGEWHELFLDPQKIAGGEHWGGANDGKWRDPAQQLVLSLTSASDPKTRRPVLDLAEVHAEVSVPVFAQAAAFAVDFEDDGMDSKWITEGSVGMDRNKPFKGAGSLQLSRTEEQLDQPCSAMSPDFAVSPGQWLVKLASRSKLESPDNSYSGVVQLECLNATQEVVERFTLVDQFGRHDWQVTEQHIELPPGVVSARFQARINKAQGTFSLDDLSIAYLAPAPLRDDRVSRLLFSTAQLGNLLFPDDDRTVSIRVEARQPLRDDQRTLTCQLVDYWGAEHMAPTVLPLGEPTEEKGTFVYQTELDLNAAPLEIGRYYEVHGSLSMGEKVEPFQNHTSLAILPEATTHQYPPEQIPFTSRNWDNRIPEFIRLTDRLGVRICGLWGGWSSEPPYAPTAPGLELCRELGMGWLTTTPIKLIERGNEDYDETALRQGVRNFINAYGDERPFIINLGNEPHGTGERVKKNVESYRIVYDEIKKIDPSIPVVATSVEPNEEYFSNGYGQWCDAFDFHIYEGSEKVRRTMESYRALMQKYDVVKPLWSTELGLNSQGQSRHAVAAEVFKTLTTFFAAGGENASWFGLLYPDPEGKQHGSSGDSHNVFDCRFRRYCPRLDAIAYYNMVNAIVIKKYVEEKRYDNGIHAMLFRDREQRCLQVLWKQDGVSDVQVPLVGVKDVQLIGIDGRRTMLGANGEGVTVSVSTDPMLLLYDGGPSTLAAEFATPANSVTSVPENIGRGEAFEFQLATSSDLQVIVPPFWEVDSPAGNCYRLSPPPNSAAREVEVRIRLDGAQGELYRRVGITER